MAENRVRLTNGQLWTAQQFLDHYRSARISGTPTPVGDAPAPVPVDMSWYMGEGPCRFYHPGMFPIINQIVKNRSLAPGTYDLTKLARDDKTRSASVSNDLTAPWSSDYALRAFVFGNESAKISGRVVGLANWIAALAGVDPNNPMRAAPSQTDRLAGGGSDKPVPPWITAPSPIWGPR